MDILRAPSIYVGGGPGTGYPPTFSCVGAGQFAGLETAQGNGAPITFDFGIKCF